MSESTSGAPSTATLTVTATDGATTQALVFSPAAEAPASDLAVLVVPAMGTLAGYYEKVGLALAARGHGVLVAENRGMGGSDQKVRSGARFGYHDIVARDLPALCAAARAQFPNRRLVLLGHSLGGQLGVMFVGAKPEAVDALIVVAGGSVHYRAYRGLERWRVLFGTQLAVLVARLLGYFPGHRLGFGGLQPTRLIADWARFGRTGKLLPEGADVDYEAAMATARLPVLAVSVQGDTLAPPTSLLALVGKLRAAAVEHRTVALAPGKADPHFRWVRAPEPVLEVVSEFLARLGARG